MSLFKGSRGKPPKTLDEQITKWRRGRKNIPPLPPGSGGQELVLFREGSVVPYTPPRPSPVSPRLEQQIEKWREQRKTGQAPADGARNIFPLPPYGKDDLYATPPILDLPRYCAVHDEIWFARYIRHNGMYVYHGCISPEDVRGKQYAPDDIYDLPPDFYPAREACICGARTPQGYVGEVKCGTCKSIVCYGRTTSSDYFYCRKSCGGHGQLVEENFPEKGISPSRHRRGNAAG